MIKRILGEYLMNLISHNLTHDFYVPNILLNNNLSNMKNKTIQILQSVGTKGIKLDQLILFCCQQNKNVFFLLSFSYFPRQ